MPSISVLIPAYNEEKSLQPTVEHCLQILQQCTNNFEIIILDDGSTDGTGQVMSDIHRSYPTVIQTRQHQQNEGIARTFEELYRSASKDFLLVIPADGEYPPEIIKSCWPLLDTFDIIVCRRKQKYYSPYRRLVSASFRWLPFLLFGVDLIDPGSTKCVKREIIDAVPIGSTSVFAEAERILRAARKGYRIGSIDIPFHPRTTGQCRGATMATVFPAVRDMIRLWWKLPRSS